MGNKLLKMMTKEVKSAKYFSIVVDSSRDTSHIDQLAIILRYVKKNDSVEIHERFI